MRGDNTPKKGEKTGGRQRKFTDEELMVAIERNGGHMIDIAADLGVTRQAVNTRMKNFPEAMAFMDDIREGRVDVAEKRLAEKVEEGHVPAIIFTLRTLGRGRGYGDDSKGQSGDVMIPSIVVNFGNDAGGPDV